MYDSNYFNLRRNWIPAVIGAVGSIASSFLSKRSNDSSTARAERYNTSERIASQEYQTSEREAQNKWAEQQYLQYQSPKALYDQYAAAGLNPNLAAGAGQVGSPTAGSGSSGGAPSGTHISPAWQNMPSLSESIGQLAGAAQSFATAKKVGLDSKFLRETFDDLAADTKYSMHMKKFEALVGQYVRNDKDLALIREIGQKIKNGVATEDQIRELIKGIKIKNASDRNALLKWFETYDRDARAIEASIANTEAGTENVNADTANKGAEYYRILSDTRLKDVQSESVREGIAEIGSRIDLNSANIRKLGIESDQLEEFKDYVIDKMIGEIENLDAQAAHARVRAINTSLRNFNLETSGTEEQRRGKIGEYAEDFRDIFARDYVRPFARSSHARSFKDDLGNKPYYEHRHHQPYIK